MLINPEVITTPDYPTVLVRDPVENVDIDAMLKRLLHTQGWGLGTRFEVHFIDHNRTKLLMTGSFVVSEESEGIQTNEINPAQTMTRTVYTRDYQQVGQWLVLGNPATAGGEPTATITGLNQLKSKHGPNAEDKEGDANISPAETLCVKWNVGKRAYDVRLGDKVLASYPDKPSAEASLREMKAA